MDQIEHHFFYFISTEQIDFKEFQQRNCTGMAIHIKKVKHEFPHTKSRHSQQAWLQSIAEGDQVMADIVKRYPNRFLS